MDPDRVQDYCRGKTFIDVLALYCYFTGEYLFYGRYPYVFWDLIC